MRRQGSWYGLKDFSSDQVQKNRKLSEKRPQIEIAASTWVVIAFKTRLILLVSALPRLLRALLGFLDLSITEVFKFDSHRGKILFRLPIRYMRPFAALK